MPEEFSVSRAKWLLHNLKYILILTVGIAMFWGGFIISHQVYMIILAVFYSCVFVMMLFRAISARPKLYVGEGRLKFGRADFSFADVEDTRKLGKGYHFHLADRRTAVVDLSDFSEGDKIRIEEILFEEFKKRTFAPKVKEVIAAVRDYSKYEFNVRAKHSGRFYSVLVFLTVILFFSFIAVLFVITTGINGNVHGVFIGIFIAVLILWAICLIVEIRLLRHVFSYKDDVFTVERKGKILKKIGREDVRGVVLPNSFTGWGHLTFTMKGIDNKVAIPLKYFRSRDRVYISYIVFRIFSLTNVKVSETGINRQFDL